MVRVSVCLSAVREGGRVGRLSDDDTLDSANKENEQFTAHASTKLDAQVTALFVIKSFPSLKAHRAALISVSSALSQTPVYTARPRIRG